MCRLCRKQAARTRGSHARTAFDEVARGGQQLFIADLFSSRHRGAAITPPAASALRPGPVPPPAYRQLPLFASARTLGGRGGFRGLAERADPQLAAWVERFTTERAARYGWSRDLTWRVRTGVNIVLGFLTAPGAAVTADDLAVLTEANLPHAHVTDIIEAAGLLADDDRVPTLTAWAASRITALPAPMAGEVWAWYAVMRDGHTTMPRRRPRSETTIRLHLSWSLPALTRWAAEGKTSLREITPADVRAALPAAGAARNQMGQGLRSLFRVLKAHRRVFTNPASIIKTAHPDPTIPMPLRVDHIHHALTSTDPAQALLCALLAFHALSAHQLQHLKLTDLHGPRLHLDDRTITLADPVRERLAAYLGHRRRHWPATANPHLFVHFRSATTMAHVGHRWINLHLGPHLTCRALRNDRLLHEATTTGGDAKRLSDLFGISTRTAQRFTTTLTHPDLHGRHGEQR
ncbi:hypothetical protein ABZ485_32375 [Streptomyces albogriseolus]|uniref:hypothetical protein n=1 Tax=Streptomyces albogriseolus TaxID=1887 RepID=UPI00345F7E45